MPSRMSRAVPALAAALAFMLMGAVSLAAAGDGSPGHRGHHGHHGHHGHSWKHTSALDERWLTVHIQTNLFEIAGGNAAQAKATTAAVRDLGAELVRDHTAALAQAQAVAEKVGIPVPDRPSPLQEWAGRAVQQFSGAGFDRWFADLQVAGHEQAIVEATTEAEKGCNHKVRALAKASLPILQMHLEHAQAVLAGLGG
jgi:predicted outer membrane protein